ncbi:MAG: DUF4234 domain-containing protein [Lachnospiraceae bacterium]|nr:DUF4234 domain-containing protein [Lachnospiraceae bacterium]
MIKENRRLWKLLLLTIPTFGIYNIVFWYQLTRDLNDMNREEKKLKNYIVVLLLSLLTCGIYRWVWFFYVADRIKTTGEDLGIKVGPGPGTTLFIRLFGTFIIIGPLISNFIVIRNMNKVAKEYNKGFTASTTVEKESA